jgi:hypothetical protein
MTINPSTIEKILATQRAQREAGINPTLIRASPDAIEALTAEIEALVEVFERRGGQILKVAGMWLLVDERLDAATIELTTRQGMDA